MSWAFAFAFHGRRSSHEFFFERRPTGTPRVGGAEASKLNELVIINLAICQLDSPFFLNL